MLLRDLSSAITQQCTSKFQTNTPDEYLDYLNNDKMIECPSVKTTGETDDFFIFVEHVQVGRIRITQHHASTSFSISKTKDAGGYCCVILPSIEGSSSLISENNTHQINQQTGLTISNCNEENKYTIETGSVHIIIIIPTKEICITCSHLSGIRIKDPIKFSSIIKGRFSTWMQVLSTAVYESNIAQHYQSIKNSLEHLVISGLLLTHSNNYSDKFERSRSISPPRTVRRAINFMEEHMRDPITISAVAAHAGIGMRALQLSFQKYIGMPPGEWLLDRRLDRVHAMLMEEEETTVTQAALAWGFNDLSYFSARYQKRYGYLPSKTPHRR